MFTRDHLTILNSRNKKEDIPENDLLLWGMDNYRFNSFKSFPKVERPAKKSIYNRTLYKRVIKKLECIFAARDLINMPTNRYPDSQAFIDYVKCFLPGGCDIKNHHAGEADFPGVYYVGKASSSPPSVFELKHGNPDNFRLALIGKGVLFDTGGLNIKTGNYMRNMKTDMAGAAHVIALTKYIIESKLPIYIHMIIPVVENAIGPNSYRPDDVIMMRNGTTVEIDNTDAEGRIILADCLSYAQENEYKPELIVDIATLTGAAVVALGRQVGSIFSNRKYLADKLALISETCNDYLHPMPLFEPYKEKLNSDIADISNCSKSGEAGSITAALFLKHFIKDPLQWVHLDISAFNKEARYGHPKGGDVKGLLTLMRYFESNHV